MSEDRTRRLFAVLVLVLLAGGIVACEVPPVAAPALTPAPTEPARTPTRPPDPTPTTPSSELAGETTIVIVVPEDPPSFNAVVTDSGYDALVMELVLLGIADIDVDGNVFPELAAGLPTVDNGGVIVDEEHGTMDVTWTLRDGIRWADGEPLTSDDVLFTWNAITDPETGKWVAGSDYTDSIEKIDDRTFVVHYNTIYPAYLTQLGGEQVVIWPEHYCDASQGFTAWDCGLQPLSSGPYLLQDWQVGDHMTFVRNPAYYVEGKPAIDQIIVRIVPDATVRKAMFVTGQADLEMWLPETTIAQYLATGKIGISFSPGTRWVFRLFPNQAARGSIDPVASPHPILSDVRVRRAVRSAIQVDVITGVVFRGYPLPVWNELFRPPYSCEIPRPIYDPAAAEVLLEEAGWIDRDGDGVRECHGCTTGAPEGYPMSIELTTYSEYGDTLLLTQQLIADMLRAVGFDVKLSVVESEKLWGDYESGGIEQLGDFDLDLWDDGYAGIDPTDYLWELYHSSAAEPDSGWNVVRWRNSDFDALLEEAYTMDEVRRQEIFCQIADLLEEELPIILLFSGIEDAGYSLRLSGVQASVNDVVTWNVSNWTVK